MQSAMAERIVVLDAFTTNPGDLDWGPLAVLGALETHDRTEAGEVAERARDAAFLLLNKTPLNAESLRALPALRYVGVLATGYNTVDLAAAKALGVTVTNVPAYATDSVAQHAAAMMLDLARGLSAHVEAVRAGAWARSRDWSFAVRPIVELTGRTLGLVGIGRIGLAFARIAAGMGMRIVAADPAFPSAEALGDLAIEPASVDEVFETADVVSLHCPLTDDTFHIASAQRLARMKPGALLLNTSRGPLVDEAALAEALRAGPLAGAALDVLEQEPPRLDHPLIGAPNCLVTPHVAWHAREARRRLIDVAAANLAAFRAGAPINVVV
jgi:glycerate dehydrogenase